LSLTPEEVESREFSVTLRGFDQAEVIAFLQSVAADYRRALELLSGAGGGEAGGIDRDRARPLGRLVPGMGPAADDFQAVGDKVAEVLRAASEAAVGIRQQARQEAEDLIAAAVERADESEAAAKLYRENMEAELGDLRRQAEGEAATVLADAQREAQRLLDEAHRQHQQLAEAEADIRQRLEHALGAVDAVLQNVSEQTGEQAEDLVRAEEPLYSS
jgi:cell division initiation protein